MNKDLSAIEIEDVLEKQLYGHLGCTLPDNRAYVVPITFVYHENTIFSFSFVGEKINAMRHHPSVCFQTEKFLYEGVWKSVITWGTYEELTHEKEILAAKILFKRLEEEQGTAISPLYQPPEHSLFLAASQVMEDPEAIFYCIRLQEKTGKSIEYS